MWCAVLRLSFNTALWTIMLPEGVSPLATAHYQLLICIAFFFELLGGGILLQR